MVMVDERAGVLPERLLSLVVDGELGLVALNDFAAEHDLKPAAYSALRRLVEREGIRLTTPEPVTSVEDEQLDDDREPQRQHLYEVAAFDAFMAQAGRHPILSAREE